MPRKRHKPEEIVAKLRQVDVLTSQGRSVADAIRSIGVTEVTYYRWRQEFGGLKSDQVKRLKDLETENTRLRRAVSDLTLDKLILQEAARGNTQAPRVAAPASSMFDGCCPSPSAAPVWRSDSTARRSARSRKAVTTRSG
jgi:putative transposase